MEASENSCPSAGLRSFSTKIFAFTSDPAGNAGYYEVR